MPASGVPGANGHDGTFASNCRMPATARESRLHVLALSSQGPHARGREADRGEARGHRGGGGARGAGVRDGRCSEARVEVPRAGGRGRAGRPGAHRRAWRASCWTGASRCTSPPTRRAGGCWTWRRCRSSASFPGAKVWRGGRLHTLADPLRRPRAGGVARCSSPVGTLGGQAARAGAAAAGARPGSWRTCGSGPSRTSRRTCGDLGFSEEMVEALLPALPRRHLPGARADDVQPDAGVRLPDVRHGGTRRCRRGAWAPSRSSSRRSCPSGALRMNARGGGGVGPPGAPASAARCWTRTRWWWRRTRPQRRRRCCWACRAPRMNRGDVPVLRRAGAAGGGALAGAQRRGAGAGEQPGGDERGGARVRARRGRRWCPCRWWTRPERRGRRWRRACASSSRSGSARRWRAWRHLRTYVIPGRAARAAAGRAGGAAPAGAAVRGALRVRGPPRERLHRRGAGVRAPRGGGGAAGPGDVSALGLEARAPVGAGDRPAGPWRLDALPASGPRVGRTHSLFQGPFMLRRLALLGLLGLAACPGDNKDDDDDTDTLKGTVGAPSSRSRRAPPPRTPGRRWMRSSPCPARRTCPDRSPARWRRGACGARASRPSR